jgi:acetolactate synthase-1/2/3 large subunit
MARSLGNAMLEKLRRWGVERVYAVLGTDHVTLMREFETSQGVSLVTVPHELVAASMAMGESLGGKLGAVLVHNVPGLLNASGVLLNALTSRIPLLVLAGEQPRTSGDFSRTLRVHYAADVRIPEVPAKKTVRLDDDKPLAKLERALAIALSEPQGPVIVTFRRDLLAMQMEDDSRKSPYYPGASSKAIDKANEILSRLSRVAVITYRAGRRREAYEALRAFAETFGTPVENPVGERVNYPGDGRLSALSVKDAEGYVIVEHEAPWVGEGREGVKVWVDPDPLYFLIENHDFDCDLCVQSVPEEFLARLKLKEQDKAWAEAKREELERFRESNRSVRCEVAKVLSSSGLTVFNEYQLDRRCVTKGEFGTYFGDLGADHLGWAWGASIGYYLSTGRKAAAVTGDGSFYLSSPESVIYVARKSENLLIIFDDAKWGSVAREFERFYGYEPQTAKLERFDLSGLFSSAKIPYFEAKGREEAVQAVEQAMKLRNAAVRVIE